jgi:hypothetical protein
MLEGVTVVEGKSVTHTVDPFVLFRYGFYDFKMANQNDLHAVFEMCGITDAATWTLIMNRKGFTQLDDLGVLETDLDMTEMAKWMASHTQAEGRVLLGLVIIKRFQTLVWWICDHQKHGLPLIANDFTIETMADAAEMKTLRREVSDSEPSVKDLGKFNPDDFDAHVDAFLNLLAQSYGVLKEPVRYVVRLVTVPDTFTMKEEQQMYQFCSRAAHLSLTISWSIGSLRHSSSIPRDGLGLSRTIQRKTVEALTWHGWTTTTARANLANERLSPNPSWTHFTTAMNGA